MSRSSRSSGHTGGDPLHRGVFPPGGDLVNRDPRGRHHLIIGFELVGFGVKQEAKVEVGMSRFATGGRNGVYVDVEEVRRERLGKCHRRLLPYLPCRRDDRVTILGVDVPARLQPAVEPPVMHQEQRVAVW